MEVYRIVNAFDYMDLLIDYTAEPRKPDLREVEPFGQAPQIELIVYTNPLTCGMD